ncbi:MAG: hypothetical protein WCO18_02780 [bacterium]
MVLLLIFISGGIVLVIAGSPSFDETGRESLGVPWLAWIGGLIIILSLIYMIYDPNIFVM